MNWGNREIEEALAVKRDFDSGKHVARGVSIDSRSIKSGEIFICIRGDKTDGHRYVRSAIKAGATGIIIESDYDEIRSICREAPVSLYCVKNTTKALTALAEYRRRRMTGSIIGVTGSNGKTSSKEMLYNLGRLLFKNDNISFSRGNLNNHWGLPLSLLRAGKDDKLVILEMGMNHPGEIKELSLIARPHFSLITSIADAHIGFFNSIEEITRAKLEIVAGMESGGCLIYNEKNPDASLARETAAERNVKIRFFGFNKEQKVTADENGISFSYQGHIIKNKNYFFPAMAWNLLGALTLFEELGFATKELSAAAAEIGPLSPRRFEVFRKTDSDGKIHLLVDDSYNANEESFSQALIALRFLSPRGSLGLMAGEMAELGDKAPDAHRRIGELAALQKYDFVAVAGGECAASLLEGYRLGKPHGKTFRGKTVADLLSLVRDGTEIRKCDALLVKGSRSAAMDRISDALKVEGYV